MLGIDKYRFWKLIEYLENKHTQGMNASPSLLSSTFGLINKWKNDPKLITKVIEHESNRIAIDQIDDNKKEKQKKTNHPLATIKCFECQEKCLY